ncbi:hypothetical protein GWI33_006784 [Rhynchophorus ferrugineus]|uniref:Membrane insertase YidC/Oxa/ALB C-terminal domain-containing protein n=1 Tax=Rhynchophorus ferrugineus TaxID=354439 RepID=A0A834IH30_RHYFE|nr:hypothetical protein GWI33_006784 [Rhynchophorus ferrugineus]
MAGIYRINNFKKCLNSMKKLKDINKINNTLGENIQKVCNQSKESSIEVIRRIKMVNEAITNVTLPTKNKAGNVLNRFNDSYAGLKNKLDESCKHLYTLGKEFDERRIQLKRKNIKTKQIKKEAQRLIDSIVNGGTNKKSIQWSAVAVSASSNNVADAVSKTDVIPEPPPIPDLAEEALKNINALGEPTFASQGLGGWTPVGIIQNCLEYLHVSLGVEWWAVIAIGTLFIRLCMFPLVIMAQRNNAKMNNYLPQIQALQLKMTEARQVGDSLNAAKYGQEMMLFMKEKGLNPLKNMIVPLAQAPVFISFFMGLRQMANVPIESMMHGGLFWFTDLTVPDQYFLLPIITSTTLLLTIELGTDGAKLSSQNMVWVKYGLRALPFVIFPFTMNFPVGFLKIPKVRDYFNIEPMITYKPEQLPVKPKGFKEGLQESWTNLKITKEIEERRRLDEIQFKKAGQGPIQKTFKIPPVNATALRAKKR